jgi:lipopolysaccharide transport system ATP-binding protein
LQNAASRDDRFDGEWFWALRDIDFEVCQGEVAGILGNNGAGKSTLLKTLSRIITPTRGRVGVRGRVGSLLEVGTGFHPELTGRENIFLNGAILGLKRREIRNRFDEIVEFAEIAPFLDTPVKRYSSGMTVRLGFSVAAHLEPDVLIVDEVLSVGDQAFQRKCMGLASRLGTQGRTILLVSHNLAAISTLCTRAIVVDAGRIAFDGTPSQAIDRYLASMQSHTGQVQWNADEAPHSDSVRLVSVGVHGRTADTPTPQVEIDHEVSIAIEYEVLKPDSKQCIQLQLRDEAGVLVLFSANAPSMNASVDPLYGQPLAIGRYRCQCTLPANFLNDSRYLVSLGVGPEVGKPTLVCDSLISFVVHDTGAMRKEYLGGWGGAVVRPRLAWKTEPVSLHQATPKA